MSVFDANKNHEDWIQNDWESDDYIRNSKGRKTVEEKDDNLVYVPKFWIIMYIIFFKSSILSLIAWFALGFAICKIGCFFVDQYFIHEFPAQAHLWM